MITVGLIKELLFISKTFNQEISINLWLDGNRNQALSLTINLKGELRVWFTNSDGLLDLIWVEQVEGDTSFFGVESCDTISRIIACIKNNDNSWVGKYFQPNCKDS